MFATTIPKDVWITYVLKWLSPLDVARLRAASRWFFQKMPNTAVGYRNVNVATALLQASYEGYPDIVKLFLAAGAAYASNAIGKLNDLFGISLY